MIDVLAFKKRLEKEEGRCRRPYLDTRSKLTIGVGRNLTDNGLSDDEIDYLLDNDIKGAIRDANRIFGESFFQSINPVRQSAIAEMIFTLGAWRFLGFKKLIQAVREQNWEGAKMEALDSKWHREDAPKRSLEVALALGSGFWPLGA